LSAQRQRSTTLVSIQLGDSDNVVAFSDQVKDYDYAFVAGQAAIDRLERYTSLFDAPSRCIPIGRPSLDTERMPVAPRADERTTVLYAPTWEGGQASAGYSSLRTHAAAAVRSLAETGLRVIYRPHPLTGVRVPEFREADQVLREQVSAA